MPKFAFLDQIEQKINLLLSSKKYFEAFNLCKENILKYPEVEEFIKLKNKIEQYVNEENNRIVEEKLENLKHLWKEEKYSEILTKIKELLKLQPDSSKLKKLYLEAEDRYKKQINSLQREFKEKQIYRLNELFKNQPEELIEALYILEIENPGNNMINQIVKEYRDKLVEKKIKEKSELIDSEKFNDLENFISLLKKIDEFNPRIKELEKMVNSRKFSSQIDQSKEYVYSGEKDLDTLMKLKKYESVIKVASEVLEVDKKNSKAAQFLKKASAKYNHQLMNIAIQSILVNIPALKSEYLASKDSFIKL